MSMGNEKLREEIAYDLERAFGIEANEEQIDIIFSLIHQREAELKAAVLEAVNGTEALAMPGGSYIQYKSHATDAVIRAFEAWEGK